MSREKTRSFLRKTLNAASVVSVVLCVFTVAIQAGGGWADRGGRFHPLWGRWEFVADGQRGAQIVLIHAAATPTPGPVVPHGVPSPQLDAFRRKNAPYIRWMKGRFGFECGPSIGIRPTPAGDALSVGGTRTWLMVPYGALELAFLTLPALRFVIWPVVVRWRIARHLRNQGCTACGYNLTGNISGVCPECGTATKGFAAPLPSAPDDPAPTAVRASELHT